MKRIIIDLDGTIASAKSDSYEDCLVITAVADRIRFYKGLGFIISIHTSRNMNSFLNNVGKITAVTVPIISDWLNKHDIPYDEIWIGKPWCGNDGFYVDDRSIRPDEFISMSYDQIVNLINRNV
jgi:capsule biosynthesis phosphatase